MKSTKLFNWRHGILVGLALCAGIALFSYRMYSSKGYISRVDIACIIFASLMSIAVFATVAWWANRPEKD